MRSLVDPEREMDGVEWFLVIAIAVGVALILSAFLIFIIWVIA